MDLVDAYLYGLRNRKMTDTISNFFDIPVGQRFRWPGELGYVPHQKIHEHAWRSSFSGCVYKLNPAVVKRIEIVAYPDKPDLTWLFETLIEKGRVLAPSVHLESRAKRTAWSWDMD